VPLTDTATAAEHRRAAVREHAATARSPRAPSRRVAGVLGAA
jgi:hypothetical protein